MQHRTFAPVLAGAALALAAIAAHAQTYPGTTNSGAEPPSTTTSPSMPERSSPSGEQPAPSDPAAGRTAQPQSSSRTIDLNTVSAPQLVRAGLDEESARLIVQNRPYSKPEDVLQVEGLSERTKSALKANMDILRASNGSQK